jgi:UV DNA damage endonuclease
MSINKSIQLGLCCINTVLREKKPPIFCSRTMKIKTIEKNGLEYLKTKIIDNLKDLIKLIIWNEQNGIKVLRMSSDLFPHKSNKQVENYDFDFAKELLKQVGDLAKKFNHRLTFHPGQYNVVGTPNETAFQQTIADLSYHAEVMDLMGLDQNSVMVVHGGGIYNDKEKTVNRWCEQFELLPDIVKKRLVIENCEKCFSIEDCLIVSKRVNIPIVFDTHHYTCYNLLHKDIILKQPEYYIPLILETWIKRNIKPKFHVSEQGSGRTGHHSDFIEVIPKYLLEIPKKYNINIDIMIEAKAKEQAIFKLYDKYKFLNLKKKLKVVDEFTILTCK